MSTSFEYTIFIGKPPQEIWDALTRKELVDRYYLAPLLRLEAHPGGSIAYGYETEVIVGTVREAIAPAKLSHTFAFSDAPDYATLVSYVIQPAGPSISRLTLSHTGFADEDQTFADISGGWPAILSSLKTLLETGETLLWPR
ncbi:SRPBCC family protein [soil metagenome]